MSEIENKHVFDVYDNIASDFSDTRQAKWDWIENFLKTIEDGFYYDIGCGNGRNMIPGKSLGIDNCQKFVDEVNTSGKKAVKSDMTNIELPSHSADNIICIAVFHHLATEKRRLEALIEMKRLIKPGGRMLLSVWSIEQPKNRRIQFTKYGDTYVDWKHKNSNKVHQRYYYIFQLDEIKNLFEKTEWKILDYNRYSGNEVFVLESI